MKIEIGGLADNPKNTYEVEVEYYDEDGSDYDYYEFTDKADLIRFISYLEQARKVECEECRYLPDFNYFFGEEGEPSAKYFFDIMLDNDEEELAAVEAYEVSYYDESGIKYSVDVTIQQNDKKRTKVVEENITQACDSYHDEIELNKFWKKKFRDLNLETLIEND